MKVSIQLDPYLTSTHIPALSQDCLLPLLYWLSSSSPFLTYVVLTKRVTELHPAIN